MSNIFATWLGCSVNDPLNDVSFNLDLKLDAQIVHPDNTPAVSINQHPELIDEQTVVVGGGGTQDLDAAFASVGHPKELEIYSTHTPCVTTHEDMQSETELSNTDVELPEINSGFFNVSIPVKFDTALRPYSKSLSAFECESCINRWSQGKEYSLLLSESLQSEIVEQMTLSLPQKLSGLSQDYYLTPETPQVLCEFNETKDAYTYSDKASIREQRENLNCDEMSGSDQPLWPYSMACQGIVKFILQE